MPVKTLPGPSGCLIKPGWEVVELPPDVYSVSEVLQAAGQEPRPYYKEPLAKVISTPEDRLLQVCGKTGVMGTDKNGHRVVKLLVCGREYCPRCGQRGSEAHKRRVARWGPKVRQIDTMGYWVIEFPNSSRSRYATKAALSDFGKRVKGVFQSLGYERGLRRWHFFGDKGIKYNPHLNVITDGDYIPPGEFEEIKNYMRDILGEPDLIVHYEYRVDVVAKVHTIEYVNRATFLNRAWSPSLAEELHKFHNSSYWGKWNSSEVWSYDDLPGDCTKAAGGVLDMDVKAVERISTGCCPKCGEKMDWTRPVNTKEKVYLRLLQLRKRLDKKPPGLTAAALLKSARGILGNETLANDIQDIVKARCKRVPNIVFMDIVEQIGQPLGAGYWLLPDDTG